MKQYLDLMRHIRDNGTVKTDRTGTGTKSIFGYQMRFNLQDGFPLVTTKKVFMKAVIHELLWFLQGSTNIKYLQDNGVTIWDEWAKVDKVEKTTEELNLELGAMLRSDTSIPAKPMMVVGGHVNGLLITEDNIAELVLERAKVMEIPLLKSGPMDGELGPIYGKQWRSWEGANGETFDQITAVINRLKTQPDCRRIIVSAWNVAEIGKMALAPCHCFFQFNSRPLSFKERLKIAIMKDNRFDNDSYLDTAEERTIIAAMDEANIPKYYLDCQLYQRSADTLLGVPFNIASYALLTMMIAHVVNMVPGDFVHTFGDAHLYSNHAEQVELQLSREPRALPVMKINPDVKDIFSFKYEDFTLEGYDPHPAIKAPVAV